MTQIHVLDDATINKIAAGEVVERPASVVKELVENAMDAGATAIEIEIMGGGVSFIRVTDNGRGMTRADAGAAILRHATSKITSVSDLQTVATLGFRGEALPTIASVSRFSLLTRKATDDLGTRVDILGGKPPSVEEAGCEIGTTVRVEELFFNTPARKKFLKTNTTEAGRISDYVIRLALSRPDIAFRFINNNRLTIMTAGDDSLRRTIESIYGGDAASALIPLDFYDDAADIRITGYISKPSLIRSSRAWQTYIVNGRTIQNRAIAKAIDNVYRSLVPKMGFPLAVIVITVIVVITIITACIKIGEGSSAKQRALRVAGERRRGGVGEVHTAVAAGVARVVKMRAIEVALRVDIKGEQAAFRQTERLRRAGWQFAEVELRQQRQRLPGGIARVIALFWPVADAADARGGRRQIVRRMQAVRQRCFAAGAYLREGSGRKAALQP